MCAGTMPSRGGQRAHRCLTQWHRARSGRIEHTEQFVRSRAVGSLVRAAWAWPSSGSCWRQANKVLCMPRYPDIEPYETGLLDAGDGNLVYWEICGNPDGVPALIVHGGPGSGCTTGNRSSFDLVRPGESGGRYVFELLFSLPVCSA